MRLRPALLVAFSFALLPLALTALGGCYEPQTRIALVNPAKDYYHQLPPGEHALRKLTDPAQIPDFTAACQDVSDLDAAAARSLAWLAKPSSKTFFPICGISHERVRQGILAFRELLASGKSPADLNRAMRERFDVYTSVGWNGEGEVLYTGYYTPIFEASKTRGGKYHYPLHRLPKNHVKDERTGETLGLRRADGTIDPDYPDRARLLASKILDGTELVWFTDPVEAYIVSVQGSAVLRLPDASTLEIGYAGTNGKPYVSVGLELIKAGKIKREELSLPTLLRYFREHPDVFKEYSLRNPRYIFFQEVSGGPFGSLGEKVTPNRSIATDKSIFPRAALCLVTTRLPQGASGARAYSGFVFDQDTGGAIRAPGRCDFYMGVGDEAGARAGQTYSEGRLYYLVAKE